MRVLLVGGVHALDLSECKTQFDIRNAEEMHDENSNDDGDIWKE